MGTESNSNEDLPKAACCLVIDREGLILAVSRKDDHDNLNLPGGKLEDNETCSQAAARELLEETGLKAVNLEFVYGEEVLGDVTHWVATYLTKVEGKVTYQTGEGIVRWVDPKRLLKGSFRDYNKKLFDLLKIDYS